MATFYGHANVERLDKLVSELQPLRRTIEVSEGQHSAEDMALRYAMVQLVHSSGPESDATRSAATELWNAIKASRRVYSVRSPQPNSFCFHDPVKASPWQKRCKERYATLVELLECHAGVKVQVYFEEDMHTVEHAPDAHDAWQAAMQQQQQSLKWGLI